LIQIDRRGAGEQRRNYLYHLFGEMVSGHPFTNSILKEVRYLFVYG
jgi:hypothetical protein